MSKFPVYEDGVKAPVAWVTVPDGAKEAVPPDGSLERLILAFERLGRAVRAMSLSVRAARRRAVLERLLEEIRRESHEAEKEALTWPDPPVINDMILCPIIDIELCHHFDRIFVPRIERLERLIKEAS